MAEQLITVNSTAEGAALCGSYDRNLDILRKEYQVELILRGCDLKIIGEEDKAAACARAVEALLPLAAQGKEIDELNVRYAISVVSEGD